MAKNKYQRCRKKRRVPEEGYVWALGGRYMVKDPTHPRWQNEATETEEDPNIARIAAHTGGDDNVEYEEKENEQQGTKLKGSSPELDDYISIWSTKIKVDMTCKEFGMHIIKLAEEIVESKDYLIESVKAMCKELNIPIDLPKVVVDPQKAMPQSIINGLKVLNTGSDKSWDSNAYFTSKRDHEQLLSYTANTSAKSRDVKRLKTAVNVCGTVAHATVTLHHYMTKVEPIVGVNLGVIRNPDMHAAAASDILRATKAFLHSPRVHTKNTNDAISLQKTLFSVIVPPYPATTAPEIEQKNHRVAMKQIVGELELTGAMKRRVIEASMAKRDLLLDPELMMETNLIKVHQRKCPSDIVITPELIDSFEQYLLTCEVTCDSPNKKDVVFARDNRGKKIKNGTNGGYLKSRNRYYQRGLGWLYKHATKPVTEGGFVGFHDDDGNICVSQTTMERIMPHNYKRLTNTLKSSCRCSSCLDAEYLHEDLMSWRDQYLKDMQKEVANIKTWLQSNVEGNESYKRKEQQLQEVQQELVGFKRDVFRVDSNGKLVQKILTMEDALDLMTCSKIGPSHCDPETAQEENSKFHHYKCCLGRCDKCPSLPINRGEDHHDVPDSAIGRSRMIIWRFHEHRNWCKLHGAIEKGECGQCLVLPKHHRPKEPPRKTYDPVKKTASIGEFMRNHYSKFIVGLYRQHSFQRRALGKNWCKQLRDPFVMLLRETHSHDVQSGWDYSDRMGCEYHNATMTESMGRSAKDVGMEGCCHHLLNEILEKVERHWYGFLSDEKQQDARTSFVNRCKFIEDMQSDGKLTKGSTLWMQTDGCGKQYKCHNFMQMHVLLAKKYQIRIDVMITTAGHGKCLVDSLAGTDKHHLDKGRISEMDPTRIDEYNQARSEAHKACVFLSSVDRMLGSYKHTRQTEDQFEIKSRRYAVTNYDATVTEDQARKIPFKNTNFGPVSGWKPGKKNGIKEMFHFRFDYRVHTNTAMARRIPCACAHCTVVLDKEWIGLERDPEVAGTQTAPTRVHPRNQPSYQQPTNCVFSEMMRTEEEDLNAWHFIDLAPIDGRCDDQELDEFFATAMDARSKEIETEIVVGALGALSATTYKKEHGFYLMQWTKKPHTLQAPAKVYGIKDMVSAGQVVCEGVFWDRIDHSDDWFQPPENKPGRRPKKNLVLLSQVLCGKVCFKRYIAGVIQPPATALIAKYNQYNHSKLIRLGAEEIDYLQTEQLQREGFELGALDRIEKNKKQTNSNTFEEEEEYIDNAWEQSYQ